MSMVPDPQRVAGFVAFVEAPDFAAAVARRVPEAEPAAIAGFLRSIAGEARMAAGWLAAQRAPMGGRVLEVGAGSGLLAAALRAEGFAIEAIEPVGEGFAITDAIAAEIAARLGERAVRPWRLAAAALDPARQGRFDLIFSVNVLEHMRPLHPNLDGMARVLAPGGTMLHLCPNYRVPYEPHFRLPLLPGAPSLTAHLLPRRYGRDPLWRSLNFITAGDLARFAARHGLGLELAPGMMGAAVERTGSDAAFAARQGGAAGMLIGLLRRAGLAPLLARLPAGWATPMSARITRPLSATQS